MSSYIVESGSSRSVVTVTPRQLENDYTVIESNPNGMSIVQDTNEEYWLLLPLTNGNTQLYPAIKSPYPT